MDLPKCTFVSQLQIYKIKSKQKMYDSFCIWTLDLNLQFWSTLSEVHLDRSIALYVFVMQKRSQKSEFEQRTCTNMFLRQP